MSLTEPITITVNAVPYVLARVETPTPSSTVYRDPTDLWRLTVSHQTTKAGRVRRLSRLDQMKISADPFTPANSRKVTATVQTIVDEPEDGAFSNTELLNMYKGLAVWQSDAIVGKILGGES
nr:MAG: hypothetical protein 2 [Leviviridae sp.]